MGFTQQIKTSEINEIGKFASCFLPYILPYLLLLNSGFPLPCLTFFPFFPICMGNIVF